MLLAKGAYGEWCQGGWVEVKEFLVVVPARSQTTDLNGQEYPFRVLLLRCLTHAHFPRLGSPVLTLRFCTALVADHLDPMPGRIAHPPIYWPGM